MDTGFLFVLVLGFLAGLAVLSGWLGERKGYSFALFAVLGLFLGILGVLVAALVPAKRSAPGS